MDRTDSTGPKPPSGPQRRIPRTLLWIAGAAVILRIVVAIADRGHPSDETGGGLVRWQPLASAPGLAAASRKPLLYDFTAAWCPPCHRLDAEAWTDAQVALRVSSGFVPARVVDRQREDGSNTPVIANLQRRYGISAFPTLVAADASGKEIARMEGYAGRAQFDQFLARALGKTDARSTPGLPAVKGPSPPP